MRARARELSQREAQKRQENARRVRTEKQRAQEAMKDQPRRVQQQLLQETQASCPPDIPHDWIEHLAAKKALDQSGATS
jgi:hypothetical protein